MESVVERQDVRLCGFQEVHQNGFFASFERDDKKAVATTNIQSPYLAAKYRDSYTETLLVDQCVV